MIRDVLLATTALMLTPMLAAAPAAAKDRWCSPPSQPRGRRDQAPGDCQPEAAVDGQEVAIGYRTLLRTGQKVGSGVFGQILDVKGQPILGKDGAPMISPSTDFSSILDKDGHSTSSPTLRPARPPSTSPRCSRPMTAC